MCKLNNCPQKLLSGRNRRLCLCWGGDRCGCDKLWTNVPEKLSTYFEKTLKEQQKKKKKTLLILTLNIMHVDVYTSLQHVQTHVYVHTCRPFKTHVWYETKPRNTHVKQKKSVVAPTRKVVAADTGTYRLGRNGRGGAEATPPTPPPTPPLLKPGIRDRERVEEDRER